MAKGINSDTPGLHEQHKIISDGKIIAAAAAGQELMALDPQIGGICLWV